jgi:hypothetical protein
MSRLSSWTASQLGNQEASSPAHALASTARRLSFKTPSYPSAGQHQEALAPTSEPIFDEAAPLDTEHAESRKLSLDEFLTLTGVQFMDDMGPSMGMARRKSMMSASTRFNPNTGDNQEEEDRPKGFDTTLADQAIASAAILPVMDMYRLVSNRGHAVCGALIADYIAPQMGRELRSSLSENAQLLDELDEAVNDETPQLFRDFMDASDEERSMLEVRWRTMPYYTKLIRHLADAIQAHEDFLPLTNS